MSNIIYFSYDADSAGSQIGRAVLNNDLKGIKEISERIHAGNQLVYRWAKDRKGIQYSSGGDQGVYAIPSEFENEIEELRKDYQYLTGLTISVGTGKLLSESGQALLMAKLKGKNQIVKYGDDIKKEIEAIKKRIKKGAFKSMEEHKLAEAYLKKAEDIDTECEYCKQSDGVDPDHCQWCHGAEVQDGEENCPYCKDMQNDPAEGAQLPEVGEEDCAFCNEMEQEDKDNCPYCTQNESDQSLGDGNGKENDVLAPRIGTSPDSTNETAPTGSDAEQELYDRMDMTAPIIGKPLPPDQRPPIGQNAPMDVVPKTDDQKMESPQPSGLEEPRLNVDEAPQIDPEDSHSKEAMQMIAEQIEKEGRPDTQEMNAIDDTDMPMGNEAEGNISRPDGFAQNTPQDMGQEGTNPPVAPGANGEEPDFYDVLETGLNEHADGIKREKTIQVVSQALMQFKASKMTLENIKMQSPDLYNASISMLRAMIEMASLLGLGQADQSAAPQQELGSVQTALTPEPEAKPQEEQNDEWHDPFPTHPDMGGESKPSHAPSKNNAGAANENNSGAIGQPIGKLSAKHTTAHVARTPTPPGAINEKGQQKVIDPKTGKTRWIDRKQGMVQSATGVPIKAPSRGTPNATKN